jgi:D-amino peptidase
MMFLDLAAIDPGYRDDRSMRIMLVTDMEGVAGVKNAEDWLTPSARCYDAGCRLLTLEVNAAVGGFFAGGAEYVQVCDGHGAGGIDIELLDPRVEYARGWPEGWPDGLDSGYTGLAFVGQHAKASSELAHLPHTQSFKYIDLKVNGVSIGEFGQAVFCAAELHVPAFYAAGDFALVCEAQALVPGIDVCAVKRGVTKGAGEECTTEQYARRNAGAVHISPQRACELIRRTAENAACKLKKHPSSIISLHAPFESVTLLRPDREGEPKTISCARHPSSVIQLMRMPLDPRPIT